MNKTRITSVDELIEEAERFREEHGGDADVLVSGPPGDDAFTEEKWYFGEPNLVVGLTHDFAREA